MPGRNALIVGIGNTIQGFDGFGPAVIARLREREAALEGVTLLDAGTNLLGFLDRFAAADLVVLVDAYLGSGSGNVSVIEESTFATWPIDSPGVHDMSAVLAVRLFRELYSRAPTAFVLVGLDAPSIESSTSLSPAHVDAGVRSVLNIAT